jgi:hypothetical protein
MDRILVATPLRRGSVSKSFSFQNEVTIEAINPIKWELSVAKRFMSDDDRDQFSRTSYWLVVSKNVEDARLPTSDDALYEKARQAMYALQIIHPSGGLNTFLKFLKMPDGFDNLGSLHPTKLGSTWIGRMTLLEDQDLQLDYDKVFRGIARAFDERLVRLQNPILLLEHGLQQNHVYLSTLMWVMGLDMLFMAGSKNVFVDRVAGFLGKKTLIFPNIPVLGRQPGLTVGEVLEDLYDLRNVIAHGKEILNPFRAQSNLLDTNRERINVDDYSYAAILWESSLFLLVRALRTIMVRGLVDVVKDEAQWKQLLRRNARLESLR